MGRFRDVCLKKNLSHDFKDTWIYGECLFIQSFTQQNILTVLGTGDTTATKMEMIPVLTEHTSRDRKRMSK